MTYKRKHWTLALVTASAALGLTARDARAQGYSVNRFEPSERGSEWFANESLDLRGNARPAFGIVGDYQLRPLATYDANGNVKEKVVRNMLTAHAGGAINLFSRLRLAVSMPVVLYTDGHADRLTDGTFLPSPKSAQAAGDLRFGADLRVLGEYGGPAQLAVGVQVWVPTGKEDSYAGDGKWRIAPHVALAGDISILTYAAKVGYAYRAKHEQLGTSNIGSELTYTAAVGVRLTEGGRLVIGPEFFGSVVTADPGAKRAMPLEGLLGTHYGITQDWRIGAGFGGGLTRGYGSPEIRGLLSIDWMPAMEKAANPPPTERSDRDKDGIFDDEDACPDVFGAKSSDPAKNGCPADRDGDGVPDDQDACPDVPGIKTADPKTNGCPSDRDRDGIVDDQDACPDEAGPADADPKKNGCPIKDTDKDGILDPEDACPTEPGPKDPDPKRNGCPKAFVKDGQIKILDQVKFKTGKADIEPGRDSLDVLEAVQKVLVDHPEIKKVRVEGHTDNTGGAALNKKLSGDRAATVVKWLTAHGIDAARLTSQGFGPDRPLESNTTEEGRRQNRRVEFHIAEEGK